jgi:hypothetical protein
MPTGQYFGKARNVELSTVYYLETQIDANWDSVSVVKTKPDATKDALPVVAISLFDESPDRFEIGSTTLWETFSIKVEIFARSDGQRLDLAEFIKNQLNTSWVYYEHAHASGDKSTLERTNGGKIALNTFVQHNKIDFGEDVDVYDRHRHIIVVTVKVKET